MAKQKKSTKKFLKNNNLKQLVQARKQKSIKLNKNNPKKLGTGGAIHKSLPTKNPKMMMDEDEDGDTMLHDDGVELGFDSEDDDDNEDFDEDEQDLSGEDEDDDEEAENDANLEDFDAEEYSEQEDNEDNGQDHEGPDQDDIDHKSQLEQLKQKDPEFYKFLEQNDASLLQFGESDDEDNDEEEEEEEDDDEQGDKLDDATSPPSGEKEQIVLSVKLVNSWKSSLHTSKSIRALKKTAHGFPCCCGLFSSK